MPGAPPDGPPKRIVPDLLWKNIPGTGPSLERARLCWTGRFCRCLLRVRTLNALHGDSPDIQRMLDHPWQCGGENSGGPAADPDRTKRGASDERDRHLQIAQLRIKERTTHSARSVSVSVRVDPRVKRPGWVASRLRVLQKLEGAEAEIRRLMQDHTERGILFRNGEHPAHLGNRRKP